MQQRWTDVKREKKTSSHWSPEVEGGSKSKIMTVSLFEEEWWHFSTTIKRRRRAELMLSLQRKCDP